MKSKGNLLSLGLMVVMALFSAQSLILEPFSNEVWRRLRAGEAPELEGLSLVNRVRVLAQRVTVIRGGRTGEFHIDDAIAKGIDGIIAGHSEAIEHFKDEDRDEISKQIKAAIDRGLKTNIICIGEGINIRNLGIEKVKSDLKMQLLLSLRRLFKGEVQKHADKLNIAYEPKWAIGTGVTPTSEEAKEVHDFIRTVIAENFGEDTAKKIRILYGGSVKAVNAKDFMNIYDGLLVAGAFTKTEDAVAIAKAAEEIGPKDGRIPLVTGNLKTYEIKNLAGLANELKKLNPRRAELALAPDSGSVKDLAQQVKGWFIDKIEAKIFQDAQTVRITVTLENGVTGEAFVGAPASGSGNFVKDVSVEEIPAKVAEIMQKLKNSGLDLENKEDVDKFLRRLDGTPDFSRLGANTITGVEAAIARAVVNNWRP